MTFFSITFLSCEETGNSTPNFLDSDDFKTAKQRVKKLSGAVKMFSPAIDAEFELMNANGVGKERAAVPGASSWNYKFAIRVAPEDIPKWTGGLTPVAVEKFDSSWTSRIVAGRRENWQCNSIPKFYQRAGERVNVWVFEKEGIIFKQVVNE